MAPLREVRTIYVAAHQRRQLPARQALGGSPHVSCLPALPPTFCIVCVLAGLWGTQQEHHGRLPVVDGQQGLA